MSEPRIVQSPKLNAHICPLEEDMVTHFDILARFECVLNAQVASGETERTKILKCGDCRSKVTEMQEQMNPS